jgi:hypothetical protein
MLASFMLSVDVSAVGWEGVKFRGRACQRRDPFKYYCALFPFYSTAPPWI